MTASKEYAQALFALASETNSEEQYLNALKQVLKVINQNPEYMEFLACPSIAVNERTDALTAAFSDALPSHVLSFLCLLCEKGHIKSLPGAVKEYDSLFKAANRIISAEVLSAVELTEQNKQKLNKKLEELYGCKVNMLCSVDKSLLGGVVVKVDDKILDSSLKHRLKSIKEVINQ